MSKLLNQWVVWAASVEAMALSTVALRASVSSWVKWGDRCLPGGHVAVVGETWQDYLRGLCMASTPVWGLLWGNVEAGTLGGATEIMSTVMVAKA